MTSLLHVVFVVSVKKYHFKDYYHQGGEPTSRPRANNGKYLQYEKKIICDQIRKSATSPWFMKYSHLPAVRAFRNTDLMVSVHEVSVPKCPSKRLYFIK